MKALIQDLAAKADLSPEQAEKVAGVVRDFIGAKLPDAIKGPVLGALSGENVDHVADMAKGMLGGLLGK